MYEIGEPELCEARGAADDNLQLVSVIAERLAVMLYAILS